MVPATCVRLRRTGRIYQILTLLFSVFAFLFFFFATTDASSAQTFTTLLTFDSANGAEPLSSLVQGANGNFYGTTEFGGVGPCVEGVFVSGCGTVFMVTPEGNTKILYSFCTQPNCTDGAYPSAGLVLGTDGSFYGTTRLYGADTGCSVPGCGTIFKITPQGSLTTLHSFNWNDGSGPLVPLIQGRDGDFYGTTVAGGGYGNIFKITRFGVFSNLHDFVGTDGLGPSALVQGSDGNFYGTTSSGGLYGCFCGTVFKMTPQGALTTLHAFNGNDGGFPQTALLQATDGRLYGTTFLGVGAGGSLFRISLDGAFETIHAFNRLDGADPSSPLIESSNGNLYGTTNEGGDLNCNSGIGCGTLFDISPEGSLTTLHVFEANDGQFPMGLLQSTLGSFYGLTNTGGDLACKCGTVFDVKTGLDPFVKFVRDYGRVGETGGILGQGFIGTTTVMLNDIPVSFTVKSDTYITATVPALAKTGYVKVTTPTGVLTSNVPFRVIR